MAVEILAEQIESAVIEAEIPTDTVERLAGCEDDLSSARRILPREALHRTAVKIQGSDTQISMVPRTRRSRCLNFVTAGRVTLQVEAVSKAGIDILEVGVGHVMPLRAGRCFRCQVCRPCFGSR